MNTLALPLPSGRARRQGPRRARPITLGLEFAAGIRDGLQMLRRYKALAHKTDHELARIGLKREDLPRAVITGKVR
jgi:uncharacterized protein YjiS (DUF1127 family)